MFFRDETDIVVVTNVSHFAVIKLQTQKYIKTIMKSTSGLPESTVKSLSWIPLVTLNVYIIGFNIGLGR